MTPTPKDRRESHTPPRDSTANPAAQELPERIEARGDYIAVPGREGTEFYCSHLDHLGRALGAKLAAELVRRYNEHAGLVQAVKDGTEESIKRGRACSDVAAKLSSLERKHAELLAAAKAVEEIGYPEVSTEALKILRRALSSDGGEA